MTSDAFRHVPALRGKLTPAEQSTLRASLDVVASWDERARKVGIPAGWRLSDQELEGTRHALLGQWCTEQRDLWIYGYGSLMWDPGFHFAEVRLADLPGYQRRFSYKTYLSRGTREQPALMLRSSAAPRVVLPRPGISHCRRCGRGRVGCWAPRDAARRLSAGSAADDHAGATSRRW